MLLHATDGWAVIPNWIIYTVTTNIYGLRTDPQTGAPGLGIASSTNICSRKYVLCVRHILRILDKNSLNSDLSFKNFFFYICTVRLWRNLWCCRIRRYPWPAFSNPVPGLHAKRSTFWLVRFYQCMSKSATQCFWWLATEGWIWMLLYKTSCTHQYSNNSNEYYSIIK